MSQHLEKYRGLEAFYSQYIRPSTVPAIISKQTTLNDRKVLASFWAMEPITTLLILSVLTLHTVESVVMHLQHQGLRENMNEGWIEDRIKWITTNTSQEERIVRQQVQSQSLKSLEKTCDQFDWLAPCACREQLTNARMVKDGVEILVEFPEYVCDNRENNRRSDAGRIPPGFSCSQLKTKMTLYRDQYEQPIEVEVNFKAGCEMRCFNDNCNPGAKKNVAPVDEGPLSDTPR